MLTCNRVWKHFAHLQQCGLFTLSCHSLSAVSYRANVYRKPFQLCIPVNQFLTDFSSADINNVTNLAPIQADSQPALLDLSTAELREKSQQTRPFLTIGIQSLCSNLALDLKKKKKAEGQALVSRGKCFGHLVLDLLPTAMYNSSLLCYKYLLNVK